MTNLTAKCEHCDNAINGRERDGRTAWDHENYPDRLAGGEHFPYPKAGTVEKV